jgi:hypothetical protein
LTAGFVEESAMAQLFPVGEISGLSMLSPHFDLGHPSSGTRPSRSRAVGIDSEQIVVRGDLARVSVAASKILGFLLFGIVSLFFLLMFLMWSCEAPSDAILQSQFQNHHSELDALARMSQEDAHGIRITDSFQRLENDWGWAKPKSKRGITRDKYNEYQRLFREIQLSGFDKDKVGNVYFIAHVTAFVAGGTTKGFVHCTNFGARDNMFLPCAEQGDRGQLEKAGAKGYSYRKLGKNWYIFETWD